MTLCQPKMQPHTKLRISSSYNMEKCSEHGYSKTRPKVKVTVTRKVYTRLGHPKMHPHTKFGIPTSKNKEVMPILETRSEFKVTVTGNRTGQSAILRCIHTSNLGFLPQMIKEICSIYYYSKNQVKGQV